jgi:predicted lipase
MSSLPTEPPLRDAWALINREDWSDDTFSRSKAYVCAIFSELAYWHIPAFELDAHDRIKVVPSSAYQELTSRLVVDDSYIRMLRQADLAPTIITHRYAVVTVINAYRVVFVAIRGTAYLYDWVVNLKLRKTRYLDDDARFHSGFYHAISECFAELANELSRYKYEIPVYVTGHSLGGAMAALAHAIPFGQCRICGGPHNGLQTSSAYTFGMPRYANEYGVRQYRCPYHLMKTEDIVPTVPPRWLGYANSRFEYALDGTSLSHTDERETSSLLTWVTRLALKKGIKEHFIEGYRRDLA